MGRKYSASSSSMPPGLLILNSAQIIYLPITYYWIGLLRLDHSHLVRNLTNSKTAETKALEPLKSFVSATFQLVDCPTRYEWSKIKGTVQ